MSSPRLIHVAGEWRSAKTTIALELFSEQGGDRNSEDVLWFDDGVKQFPRGMRDLWGARPIPEDDSVLIDKTPRVIIVSTERSTDLKVFVSRWPDIRIERIDA